MDENRIPFIKAYFEKEIVPQEQDWFYCPWFVTIVL